MTHSTSREGHRPYLNLIVADLPGDRPRAIERTHNKADADDHVRFLKRRLVQGALYIAFDPEPQAGVEV